MRRTAIVSVAVAIMGWRATPLFAQASGPGTVEISAGAIVANGLTLSSGAANETTPSGGSYALFTTTTTLARAAAAEVRIAVHLTSHLDAAGTLGYGTPRLRIAASGDAEGAAPVIASERLEEVAVTGGVVWYPRPLAAESRLAPFLTAEAGFLRVLHGELTLGQDDREYLVGGGVKFILHRGGGVRMLGLRIDARGIARARGLFPKTRVTPAVGAALFMRF